MTNSRCKAIPLLAGAVVGAVVVALTTPKNGPQLRSDLLALGRKAKIKLAKHNEELDQGLGLNEVNEGTPAVWAAVEDGAFKAGQANHIGNRHDEHVASSERPERLSPFPA